VHLTHHAVDRFHSRHVPHLAFHEARTLLASLVPGAAKLRAKTWNGQDQWLIEKPRVVLVTKTDPGNRLVVVTVLPEPVEQPSEEDLDEFRAAAERLAPSYRETPPPSSPPPLSPRERQRQKEAEEQRQAAERRAQKQQAHEALMAEHARQKAEREAKKAQAAQEPPVAPDAPVAPAPPCAPPVPATVPREQYEAAQRTTVRLRAHADLMEGRSNASKRVARIALLALEPLLGADHRADAAWAAVAAIEPGMVTDAFLRPEKRRVADEAMADAAE
jgi:chemotaxis protein histidine kinase CheA